MKKMFVYKKPERVCNLPLTIKLYSGPDHSHKITKQEIQKNIDALQRAIDGKSVAIDFVLLIDTMSILEAIKAELPSW